MTPMILPLLLVTTPTIAYSEQVGRSPKHHIPILLSPIVPLFIPISNWLRRKGSLATAGSRSCHQAPNTRPRNQLMAPPPGAGIRPGCRRCAQELLLPPTGAAPTWQHRTPASRNAPCPKPPGRRPGGLRPARSGQGRQLDRVAHRRRPARPHRLLVRNTVVLAGAGGAQALSVASPSPRCVGCCLWR